VSATTCPNTAFPKIFFDWVRSQSSIQRESRKIQEALGAFGIEKAKQDEFARVIDSVDFKAWASAKFGLHRPQSNYGAVSSRLTPATIVGLAVHYINIKKPIRNGGGEI
jgi:hypothetical protein